MSTIVDFSAGYQPPGVYVQTQSTNSVSAVGIDSTVICLVGDGVGYEPNSEGVSFATSNSVTLAKKYIDQSSIVVSLVSDTGTTVYAADVGGTTHDYSVSVTNYVTTITRETTGTIPTNEVITVSYRYADDSYYALNKFADYASLSAVYGPALDPVTGAVSSPISFAAEQAFRNGASYIYAVAVDPRGGGTRAAQFRAAYALLHPNYEINIVVPLTTDAVDTASATTYLTDVAAFLDSSAKDGFAMTALCGVMASYATTDPDTLATSVANRRLVLLWPPALTHFNQVLNASATIDGIYFAAACAGVLANQSLNRGLTRSQVKGFTGIPAATLQTMTTSKKNTWSSKGVSVAEPNRAGQIVIRQGVTTNVANIGDREISIVRCQDALYEMIQVSLEGANMIGNPITSDTPLAVASLVSGVLENALAENYIRTYTGLVVNQQTLPTGDPTVVQVTFSYQPIYPLNYITVSFTLDLTTNTLVSSLDASTTGTTA